MDLRYSASDERFRRELRAWLADAVPKHGAPPPSHDWPARVAYDTGWQRKLFDAGYAGINWPKAYGGRELSATEQLVYYEETARANGIGPRESGALGILMNTRGLMQLIVLGLGLELGILSPTLFTMFVIMAVVTTFATTPILDRILGARGFEAERAAA